MPGAWEHSSNSILIGVLHTDVVPTAWAFGLRNLQVPGVIIPVAGMPYDMARNSVCMKALEGGFTHAGFLDSDVVPPNDAFLRLLAHRRRLISGVYYRRSPPHGLPVAIKDGTWAALPDAGIVEVDYVGAGCLVVEREVLERMPPLDAKRGKHWYDWRVDMAGVLPPGEALSEDFAMNLHLKRTLGIPTLIDCSVKCRHVGLADFTHHSAVPCNTTHLT